MAQSLPNRNRLLEKYVQVVREDGLNTNKNVNIGINGASASLWVSGGVSVGGAVSGAGGQAQSGTNQSTVFHSGGYQPVATTGTTDKTVVTTETYYAEVFIPDNTTVTGISVLNGTTTSASANINVGLADSTGKIVAKSATTTAQAAANSYQQIPFTAPYSAIGPSKYYIAVQGSATTAHLATHTIGNFGASKVTSETYGTFLTTASYATTTFTTALGPIADTY